MESSKKPEMGEGSNTSKNAANSFDSINPPDFSKKDGRITDFGFTDNMKYCAPCLGKTISEIRNQRIKESIHLTFEDIKDKISETLVFIQSEEEVKVEETDSEDEFFEEDERQSALNDIYDWIKSEQKELEQLTSREKEFQTEFEDIATADEVMDEALEQFRKSAETMADWGRRIMSEMKHLIDPCDASHIPKVTIYGENPLMTSAEIWDSAASSISQIFEEASNLVKIITLRQALVSGRKQFNIMMEVAKTKFAMLKEVLEKKDKLYMDNQIIKRMLAVSDNKVEKLTAIQDSHAEQLNGLKLKLTQSIDMNEKLISQVMKLRANSESLQKIIEKTFKRLKLPLPNFTSDEPVQLPENFSEAISAFEEIKDILRSRENLSQRKASADRYSLGADIKTSSSKEFPLQKKITIFEDEEFQGMTGHKENTSAQLSHASKSEKHNRCLSPSDRDNSQNRSESGHSILAEKLQKDSLLLKKDTSGISKDVSSSIFGNLKNKKIDKMQAVSNEFVSRTAKSESRKSSSDSKQGKIKNFNKIKISNKVSQPDNSSGTPDNRLPAATPEGHRSSTSTTKKHQVSQYKDLAPDFQNQMEKNMLQQKHQTSSDQSTLVINKDKSLIPSDGFPAGSHVNDQSTVGSKPKNTTKTDQVSQHQQKPTSSAGKEETLIPSDGFPAGSPVDDQSTVGNKPKNTTKTDQVSQHQQNSTSSAGKEETLIPSDGFPAGSPDNDQSTLANKPKSRIKTDQASDHQKSLALAGKEETLIPSDGFPAGSHVNDQSIEGSKHKSTIKTDQASDHQKSLASAGKEETLIPSDGFPAGSHVNDQSIVGSKHKSTIKTDQASDHQKSIASADKEETLIPSDGFPAGSYVNDQSTVGNKHKSTFKTDQASDHQKSIASAGKEETLIPSDGFPAVSHVNDQSTVESKHKTTVKTDQASEHQQELDVTRSNLPIVSAADDRSEIDRKHKLATKTHQYEQEHMVPGSSLPALTKGIDRSKVVRSQNITMKPSQYQEKSDTFSEKHQSSSRPSLIRASDQSAEKRKYQIPSKLNKDIQHQQIQRVSDTTLEGNLKNTNKLKNDFQHYEQLQVSYVTRPNLQATDARIEVERKQNTIAKSHQDSQHQLYADISLEKDKNFVLYAIHPEITHTPDQSVLERKHNIKPRYLEDCEHDEKSDVKGPLLPDVTYTGRSTFERKHKITTKSYDFQNRNQSVVLGFNLPYVSEATDLSTLKMIHNIAIRSHENSEQYQKPVVSNLTRPKFPVVKPRGETSTLERNYKTSDQGFQHYNKENNMQKMFVTGSGFAGLTKVKITSNSYAHSQQMFSTEKPFVLSPGYSPFAARNRSVVERRPQQIPMLKNQVEEKEMNLDLFIGNVPTFQKQRILASRFTSKVPRQFKQVEQKKNHKRQISKIEIHGKALSPKNIS